MAGGYRIAVICPADPGRQWCEAIDGVQVYRYPAPAATDSFLGYVWEYGYTLTATFLISLFVYVRRGFDIIHAHNPPDLFVCIAAFYKLLGKQFVYDHHDLAPEMYAVRFQGKGNRFVTQVLGWFERLSCRLADHVIATNQSYKMLDMQRNQVPEQRITVVRNGPDLERFRSGEPDPQLRHGKPFVLGYAGTIGFQDGVDYLVWAVGHLVSDLHRTDFVCLVVGDGDAWSHVQQLAKELRLTKYLHFVGRVDPSQVGRYLYAMDICIAPEPSDAYNDRCTVIKIAEYMACGKPIVAFDLPEHRVTAQDAAVYAQPNDALDFARHIATLLDDPQQREEMGRKGKHRAETELAWPHQEQYLFQAYQAL